MPPKTKSKKRKSTPRRKTKRKRKGVQIGSPQVFELYGGT